jgi:hypothetical protein
MTLIELVISVTIVVTLIGAAAGAFSAGISSFRETDTTFAESHDVQLVGTYLPVDIQSVQDSTAAGGQGEVVTAFDTGAGYCDSGGTNLVKFKWYDGTTTYMVDYRIQQDGATWSLVRWACESPISSVGTKRLVVGHELLDPANAAWTAGGTPASLCGTRVDVAVHLASAYSFTVSANRRTSTAAPATCRDFAMAIAPSTQTVRAGGPTSFTVTVTPSGGFGGTVTLSSPDLPSGATATFTPVSFGPGETSPKTSTMTVTTSTSTPTGNATFTVNGVSGSLSRSATASLLVTASVPPEVLQIEMFDGRTGAGTGNPNGKIDELIVLFDSPLVLPCTTASDWTLVAQPAGTTVASVTKPDSTHLNIRLNEGTVVDTAAKFFQATYAPSNCEADPILAVDVIDRVGPIAMTIASPAGGNRTPAAGDKIEITFSEAITNCAPTSSDVVLSAASGGNPATTLSLSNVAQGSFVIGSNYVRSNRTVRFNGSAVACSGQVLTITLGSCSATPPSQCSDARQGNAGTYTVTPVASLLNDDETPPNVVVSTVAATGGGLF